MDKFFVIVRILFLKSSVFGIQSLYTVTADLGFVQLPVIYFSTPKNHNKMSSQRGNHKKGPQKHQNRTSFKNNLHDTSKRTKEINELVHHGLCERCKEIIEWKIKYKKYKPLTVPKKW